MAVHKIPASNFTSTEYTVRNYRTSICDSKWLNVHINARHSLKNDSSSTKHEINNFVRYRTNYWSGYKSEKKKQGGGGGKPA